MHLTTAVIPHSVRNPQPLGGLRRTPRAADRDPGRSPADPPRRRPPAPSWTADGSRPSGQLHHANPPACESPTTHAYALCASVPGRADRRSPSGLSHHNPSSEPSWRTTQAVGVMTTARPTPGKSEITLLLCGIGRANTHVSRTSVMTPMRPLLSTILSPTLIPISSFLSFFRSCFLHGWDLSFSSLRCILYHIFCHWRNGNVIFFGFFSGVRTGKKTPGRGQPTGRRKHTPQPFGVGVLVSIHAARAVERDGTIRPTRTPPSRDG